MDNVNWKPLPKRERRSNKKIVNTNSSTSNDGSNNNDMDLEVTNSEENAKQVDENICFEKIRFLNGHLWCHAFKGPVTNQA